MIFASPMIAAFASPPVPFLLLSFRVLLCLILQHLPLSHASQFSSSSSVAPSLCNPRDDSLFLADSTDRQAFFQCRAFAALPSIGFWERHFCPNGMHFAYATQQCTANSIPREVIRDSNELFRIAILNGSCANGERCIGGTVCDQREGRCLCPQGTVAVLENLYCASISTNQPQQETYNSYGTQNQRPNQWHHQQLLGYPFFSTSRIAQLPTQMISSASAIVPPGSNCFRNEICGGGSICLPSLAICVCPQGMENDGGRCEEKLATNGREFWRNGQKKEEFGESQSQVEFPKASLGQKCNENLGAFCADQNARCEEGHCQCVVPMVELNGKCQSLTIKESGPGELCNEGQKCVNGTMCHPKTAICVCHGHKELKKGRCMRRGEAEEEEKEAKEQTKKPEKAGGGEQAVTETTAEAPMMVPISSAEGTSSQLPKDSRKKLKKEASVGEKCSLNADCLSGAYCNGNSQPPTCQCLSTHVNVNKRCEKVIYPGQRGCETDLQCSAAYAGTRCIGRQCVCPPGSTPIDKSCIPAIAWPGERCNITHLMPVCSADSYCFEGRCVCNPPLNLFQKQCINQRGDLPSLDEKAEESDRSDRKGRQNAKSEESDQQNDQRRKGNDAKGEEEKAKLDIKERVLNNMREEKQSKKGDETMPKKEKTFENGTNTARKKKTKIARMPTEISGMEQIFNTLALLKSAALDRTERRNDKKTKNGKNETEMAGDGGRQRRESDDTSAVWAGHFQRTLPHNHRLEGEPCSPGDFCLDGSVCVDGHCRCFSHNSCKRVPTFRAIGSQCIESVDRCVGGSVCQNSICVCVNGSLPNVEKTRCRQSPGSQCFDGQICTEESECRLGTCQCRAGMRMALWGDGKRRKCIRTLARPGESCRNGKNCIGKSICGSTKKICSFSSDQKISLSKEKSDRKRENGEKPKLMGQVQRDDNYGPKERDKAEKGEHHRKKSKPGESCAGDELCTGGSFCSESSICICAPGERVQMENGEAKNCVLELGEKAWDSGQSVKAAPGQLCVEGGMECAGGAKCQNGVCSCPEGHNLFRNECLPPRALPISVEKIHTHSALFSPESAVMDSPSSIGTDFDPNLQDPVPSKTVSPGAMCRLPLECPYRTECLRGVCRCQKSETIVNGICRKTIHEVLPGGRCDTQKGLDCVGESHCFYGICVCLYGLVNIGNECANAKVLERIAPGKRCVPGQHCTGRSKCVKGKCQCVKGLKVDAELRRCVKVANGPTTVTTQFLAYPSEAEMVAGPTSIVEIPLGNANAISERDGTAQRPTKFIYAIPAALAAAAEEGKFQQILTANQMSINLMDEDMRSLISKLVDQQKQNNETVAKRPNNCGGESGPANCQPFSPISTPISRPTAQQQNPFQSVPGSASSLQNPFQSVPGSASSLQNPFQSVPGSASSLQNPFQSVPGSASSLQNPFQSVPGSASSLQNPFQSVPGSASSLQNPFQSVLGSASSLQNPFQSVPGSASSLQNPFQSVPGSASSLQNPFQSVPGSASSLQNPFQSVLGSASSLQNPFQSVPGSASSLQNPFQSVPGSASSLQNPFQSVLGSASSLQNPFQSVLGSASSLQNPFQSVPGSASTPPLLSKLASLNSPPHLQGQPGYFCADGHVCHGGAICLANLCICRPGFRPIDGFCQISKVNLGEQCFLDEQCKSNGFCIDGFCHCRAQFGAVRRSFVRRNVFRRHRCPTRPVAAVGEECSKGQACGWNSICGTFSGVCECAVGMENDQGACVAALRPRGTECLSSSNCHKFAFCDNGFCSCKVGFERIAGFCLPPARPVVDDPKAYIDPETMAAALLNKNGNNLETESAEIEAKYGLNEQILPNALFQAVLRPKMFSGGWAIGERMDDDSLPMEKEFLQPNNQQKQQMHFPPKSVRHFPAHSKGAKTMELERRKAAKDKTKQSERNANSRKQQQKGENGVAMPGEYCGTREKQCVGNSKCLRGWCQCAEGAHIEKGGTCAAEPKTSLLPSSAASSEFLSHKGHRPFDSCFSNSPCISGASCVRSAALLFVQKLGPFCQCNPGLIFQHNQCVPRRPELKVAKPGEKCRAPSVICDFGSICGEENICKCPANRKFLTGHCVHLSLPGESCENGEFCADGAICAPGLNACVCQVGWNVRNGKCRKGKKLRKLTTRADETRRRERGGQMGRRQTTAEGLTESHATSSVAKPLLLLGQPCQFDSDCGHLLNAHCAPVTRQCACKDRFTQFYASICVPADRIKRPGEECISSAHFCAEQSWCKNGRCECIQRDSDVVQGHCVRKASEKRAQIRRHPPREHPKASDCALDGQWTEGKCTEGLKCPRGMRCIRGKCHCMDKVGQRREKLAHKMRTAGEADLEEGEADLEKEEVDLEWDYAFGEPMIGDVFDREGHRQRGETQPRPQHQRNTMPILPGAFCDSFSQCGEGAECFFGKCQCIFRGHRLAFVNGVTKCVGEEEKSENGAERRKRDGQPNAANNDVALSNKTSSNEFQPEQNSPFSQYFHQKSPKGSKISVPGELCGPLDTCTGSSSCVEGFCLCPAGTRPSPTNGKCESFAQQLKMSKEMAEGRKKELDGTETRKSTAPTAIKDEKPNQRPPPNSTINVPTVVEPINIMPAVAESPKIVPIVSEAPKIVPSSKPLSLSSPLTGAIPLLQVFFNQNFTGQETMLSSFSADGKTLGNVSSNLFANATDINARDKAYARPSESCSSGEICTGGSICGRANKVCECPAVKPMLRNHICIRSNEVPMIEAKVVKPGELCDSETKCVGNSICAEGSCRCQRGFRLEDVQCRHGIDEKRNSKRSDALLPPVQLTLQDEELEEQQMNVGSAHSTKKRIRMHAKPRISGPPLRRPFSSSAPSLAPAGTNGVCPPGNTPLTDQATGRIRQCNGMTPNCPPKSYCFVTGVASETYNCCKSY